MTSASNRLIARKMSACQARLAQTEKSATPRDEVTKRNRAEHAKHQLNQIADAVMDHLEAKVRAPKFEQKAAKAGGLMPYLATKLGHFNKRIEPAARLDHGSDISRRLHGDMCARVTLLAADLGTNMAPAHALTAMRMALHASIDDGRHLPDILAYAESTHHHGASMRSSSMPSRRRPDDIIVIGYVTPSLTSTPWGSSMAHSPTSSEPTAASSPTSRESAFSRAGVTEPSLGECLSEFDILLDLPPHSESTSNVSQEPNLGEPENLQSAVYRP